MKKYKVEIRFVLQLLALTMVSLLIAHFMAKQ